MQQDQKVERYGIAVVVKQIGIACEGVADKIPTVERSIRA